MIRAFQNNKLSASAEFMEKFNLILYIKGLQNFWIEPVNVSEKFTKIYNVISFFLHIITVIYSLSLLSSFVLQKNLSLKQKADRTVCNTANIFSNLYCFVFLYHRKRCREVLYTLMVLLKQEYNNPLVEKHMIMTVKVFMLAHFGSGFATLGFYAFIGILQVTDGHPFITIITGWPDVRDVSTTAEVARVIFYLFWYIYFTRVSACYLLLLTLLIGISHQYKNLQNYFSNLNSIFEDDLSQGEKESMYEKAFLRGVQMHSQTMWCTNETQSICRVIFDAQMLVATVAYISLLPIILNPTSDAVSRLSYMPLALLCLVALGYFMWNAGDISVEASKLPDAMYASGWQNCQRQSSVRVRKLVVIAMTQAQEPVVLKALGFIDLSYESYLAIIKTSYSVFSVFY